jgi:hypothetical protein
MAEKKPRAPSKKPTKRAADAAGATPEAPPVVADVVAVAPPPPSRDAIAARAYAIWRAEGGSAIDNWLRAERELSA